MPGKEFDALIIDLRVEKGYLVGHRELTLEEKLQQFLYAGNSYNIVSVFVKGNEIKCTRR